MLTFFLDGNAVKALIKMLYGIKVVEEASGMGVRANEAQQPRNICPLSVAILELCPARCRGVLA
ncbi:MAG: hypothetical protein ACUVTR_04910 [Dehalococcoidia bacterium]